MERLFLKIIENTKTRMFKIDSDMINLIGCKKENFFKLLELMQYKPIKNKKEYFTYRPKYQKNKGGKIVKNNDKNNPFDKLSELRFS